MFVEARLALHTTWLVELDQLHSNLYTFEDCADIGLITHLNAQCVEQNSISDWAIA